MSDRIEAIRQRWYGSKADDGVGITHLLDEIEKLRAERLMLARLASDSPEFFNPTDVWLAKMLRDSVLADAKASATTEEPK